MTSSKSTFYFHCVVCYKDKLWFLEGGFEDHFLIGF